MSREKQQVKSVAMHNPEGNFVLAKWILAQNMVTFHLAPRFTEKLDFKIKYTSQVTVG